MKPNPYGDFGTTVTGKRFLGRISELRIIEDRVFGGRGFGSVAVVGLPRIGKTSLVAEAVRRAESRSTSFRYITVHANVGMFDSFAGLLRSLVEDIAEELHNRGLGNELIARRIELAVNASCLDFNNVRAVFRSLRRAEIRPVCILDEFDAGRRVFRRTPHCFHWIRELCSNVEFKAAVVLVAKRRLQDVARLAGHDSDYWANVLMTLPLKPLSASEVSVFFDRLEEEGILIDEAERSELIALCGGHPYLLDAFGFHAWDRVQQGHRLDAAWIRRRCGAIAADYVRQTATILGDGPMLSKAVQVLVGPQWDVTRQDVDALCDLGVVQQDDAAELRGFSRALEDHLRTVELDVDIWSLWRDTEKALREVLEHCLEQTFGVPWPTRLCKARPKLRTMIEDCRKSQEKERKRVGDRAVTSLLAYTYPNNLYELMCADWSRLGAPLLGNDRQRWKVKFELLARVRTPLAHNREEAVSPGERTQAEGYCREILERHDNWHRHAPGTG